MPHSAFGHVLVSRPADWQVFERASAILWRQVLDDPSVQLYGRNGQSQGGIDLTGYRNSDPSQLVAIQCKCKGHGQVVTEKEFRADFEKALQHDPPIREYHFTTTADDDVEMSRLASKLVEEQHRQGRDIVVRYWGWGAIEKELAAHPDAARAFDPHYSPTAQRYEDILSDLVVGAAVARPLNPMRVAIVVAVVVVVTGVVAWGALGFRGMEMLTGTDGSKPALASAVRLGATRERIISALGQPVVSSVPAYSDIPVTETVREERSDIFDDAIPTAPEEDNEAFRKAAMALPFRAELYEFPAFVLEVDYLDGIVVQYGVILTETVLFDMTSLPDLGWLSGQGVPTTIGDSYFSDFWPLRCTEVRGVRGSRDEWMTASCPWSKFTGEVGLHLAQLGLGVKLPNPATSVDFEDGNWIYSSVLEQRLGYFGLGLLQYTPWSTFDCSEADATPLTTLEQANAAIAALSPSASVNEVTCLSMRTAQPNGFVVTDYGREYSSMVSPSGLEVYLSPDALSSGAVSFETFGFRRDPLLLGRVSTEGASASKSE